MDVGSYEARRMRPLELGYLQLRQLRHRNVCAGRLAQEDTAFRQLGDHHQTILKVSRPFGDDHFWPGRQRTGIDRGDKDRMRAAGGIRRMAVGPGPQAGPQTGCQQVLPDLLPRQSAQFCRRIGFELDGIIAAELDHHRIQNPAFASVDGRHHSGTRRGIDDLGILLVREQDIAELDLIPLGDLHRGLEAHIIRSKQGNRPDGSGIVVDDLFRLARDGQIEAFFRVD